MRVIASLLSVLVAGCGPSAEELQGRIDELESENAGLRSTLEDAQSEMTEANDAADAARMAAENAQSEVERFQNEDWRDARVHSST